MYGTNSSGIVAALLVAIFLYRYGAHGQVAISNVSPSSFTYMSYQHGVTCYAAQPPLKPTTLAELQNCVRGAIANKLTLKALGNRHSVSDMICTDGIPVSMLLINHIQYNRDSRLVTVGAGAVVLDVVERLHEFDRTLNGIPSYGDVTIGGIIAGGIHGSNLRNPATLSDAVVSIVIVDGLGNVRTITEYETLKALRAHLGLLGIIYEVTFRTWPQFKLRFTNYPVADSVLDDSNQVMRLATSSDVFHFWWFPTVREVVMSVGNRVPTSTPGNCQTYLIPEAPVGLSIATSFALETIQEGNDHLGMFLLQAASKLSMYGFVPGRSPIYTPDGIRLCTPAVGFSHRMICNRCRNCAWMNGNSSVYNYDFEVVVPLEQFDGTISTMRSIFREYPMEFPLVGIYFRFLSPSDALMTLNSGRVSVAIELVLAARKDRFSDGMMGLAGLQAVFQALLDKHQGRPHWGKVGLHFLNPHLLSRYYEHLPTFVRHMESFDPHGVFLNDFGRRLRFGSSESTWDRRVKHCALLDHCVCSRDSDCGNGPLVCGNLQGYRVCRVNRNLEEQSNLVRSFLNLVK